MQLDGVVCSQKIEEPVRSNFPEGSDSGAQNFGPKQGEADDFLKSKTANPDKEIFGTEVGVADAMRFKGAGAQSLPWWRRSFSFCKPLTQLVHLQLLRSSTADSPCWVLWQLLLLSQQLAKTLFNKHRQNSSLLLWWSSPSSLPPWYPLSGVYQEEATASSQLTLSFGMGVW